MEMVYAGIIAALAMILLLLKLDMQKVYGYSFLIDVGFTGLLAWMLAGTYSGMMAALVGGAIVSIYLYFYKRVNGYKKLKFEDNKLTWRTYNV